MSFLVHFNKITSAFLATFCFAPSPPYLSFFSGCKIFIHRCVHPLFFLDNIKRIRGKEYVEYLRISSMLVFVMQKKVLNFLFSFLLQSVLVESREAIVVGLSGGFDDEYHCRCL